MRERIIIGHRGAAGVAPENTLLSYRTALEMGAEMIELDVHETNDGHLVCIHDFTVDRTTNGTGAVTDMTLPEIRALDAGLGEMIPLLSEVLDFARSRLKVNIELKTLDVEKKVLDLAADRNMLDSIIVSSFLHGTIIATKELNPTVETAALINNPIDELISYVVNLGADAINPHYSLVTRDMIEDAHSNSLRIFPWTINDTLEMVELFKLEVDGIITDYPNLGLDALRSFSI